jgi:protein-tyrosine phosphatase
MLDRINFRDFGGEITPDGKRIRTGLLFRTGVWQRINESDRILIQSLNIQHVVDFRSLEEQERSPALLPGENKVSLPCNIDRSTRDRLKPLLFKRHADERIMEVIEGVYIDMVDMMVEPMAKLIRLIISPGGAPLIIHCRAGKDRTGFAAAMIQWYLGLDHETILEEYLRSNEFMNPRLSKLLKRLRIFTVGLFPKGNLQAAFEVKERYLSAAMAKVEKEYGGIEKYFLSAGITPAELDQLHLKLLDS